MKRETLRHPKLYELCAALQCSRPEALGYLTLLWDFTADQATEGNVGKWGDGAIARACDWQGDPAEFIEALVNAGWLDQDPEYRLVVHDWCDHAERWVSLKLQKLKRDFVRRTTEPSIDASTERVDAPPTESTTEPSPPRDQTEPNRTKPVGGADAPADCPHQEIIALYHELLPTCPRVREWTEPRAQQLRMRWREKAERQSLEWWRRFFAYCGESRFLTGHAPATGDRPPFVASLDWLLKQANFVKVVEGVYHRERTS